MRHAGDAALDQLGDLLAALRRHAALREKRPGVFYRKGRAWLHFHEDPAGIFADLRAGDDWQRFRVTTADERAALVAAVDRAL